MFVGGIGSHLKVSQVDQSVCLGNELNNLSAIKRFFQIIAPYQIYYIGIRYILESISSLEDAPYKSSRWFLEIKYFSFGAATS